MQYITNYIFSGEVNDYTVYQKHLRAYRESNSEGASMFDRQETHLEKQLLGKSKSKVAKKIGTSPAPRNATEDEEQNNTEKQGAQHWCVHRPETRKFLCLSEACLYQGLVCLDCKDSHHGGDGHNITNLDQLRREGIDMRYERLANVQELMDLLMSAR